MAVLDEIEKELAPPKKSDMVGGVSRGAVGRRRRKKPESVLDEVNREVSDEPEPEDVLTQVRRETETDPETVRRMRAEGQRLSTEQQKIAFEAERARPLTDVALGAAGAFVPAALQTAGQLVKGTAKLGYKGVINPLSQTILSGLTLDPDAEKQAEDMRRIWGTSGAAGAWRSLASGAAQDIEETVNAAVRAGTFGTSITDLAAEKLGIISPEQSFNNYLAREDMRRGEAEDIQENPDRAATLLARNPLAGTVIDVAASMSDMGALTPEQKKAALDQYQEKLYLDAKFVPDPDISMVGEMSLPGVSMPAAAVRPLTKALGGTMEAAGGLAVRGVTKPTIRGVNPLEGVGIGIRKIGALAEAAGARVSEAITGRPDTFFATPGTFVSAFTRRPGQLIEGTGRTLRDIGRQIDEGGIRGRTGIIERLGRDPQTAPWLQDLFGPGSQKKLQKFEAMNKKRVEAGKAPRTPGRGGVNRARTADYGLRLANSLSKSGVSGAALNGIIGAADIETAEEFGRATGVGFGIGSFMAARVPERVGAALDPRLDMRTRIDRVVETDPLDRRLDEEADRKRFQATADPNHIKTAETASNPDLQIEAKVREIDGLFQLKAEMEYGEEDTTDLDNRITEELDKLAAFQEEMRNMTPEQRDERRRLVELAMIDVLDILRTNHNAAGMTGVDFVFLRTNEIEGFLREKYGQNLERAEAIVQQLSQQPGLSQSENETLRQARDAVARFNELVRGLTGDGRVSAARGVAFDPAKEAEFAYGMANISVPTGVINVDRALIDPDGFRHTMLHEGNHVLRQFQQVREMQQPMEETLFGRQAGIPDEAGNRTQVSPGLISNELLDTFYIPLYAARQGRTREQFEAAHGGVEQAREYIREEILSEVSGVSEQGARTIRETLDSPGQAIIDRLLISRKNSMLGRLRAALEFAGVRLDPLGNVQSVLFPGAVSGATMPEVLAMMRQFKREMLEYTDAMTFASKEMRDDVRISMVDLMNNRALQEAFTNDVIWDKELVLDVKDETGAPVAQIPIPDSPLTDVALGEYRIVNGQLVDEDGTVLPVDPSVNLTAMPDGARASVTDRIARNPDGTPKILQQKEIDARARQRGQMIKDAIDNAPDDGSPTRLRDSGNGYYVGIPSQSQLNAIAALPNKLVAPYVKRNLVEIIKIMQRRDGSRVLMEYQPALRRGKYRALAPKIRDVVPIGFRYTKDGNWLAVNVSVSRMFDKLNLWAQKKPENLNLWGRSTAKFMDDVLRVLDNHNKGLAGQTNLDVDPDLAMQKKNRVNDFFNMFTKDTEAANPSRTKLPARRGQDSADRILMSARIDRINQMQESYAQKFPVDYGKMKVNFMPGEPNGELRLDDFADLDVENDLGPEMTGSSAQFLPGIRYTSLPDDPKKTMADFYMLNAMLTTPPTGWSLGEFGGMDDPVWGKKAMYAPSADPTGRYAGMRAEKYQDALDEAKQTLIPTLHSKITKALHFAVAAELRHIEDQVARSSIPQDLIETPFFQEYMREYAIQKSGLPGLKKQRAPRRYKSDSESFRRSFVAMEAARQKTGTSLSDVALLAERMFREPRWSSSYGGPKWGDIAQHLAKMSEPEYSTEKVRAVVTDPETGRMQMIETNEFRDPGAYSQMFQEIDRAYDLQHNTNTVFNKLKKYYLGTEGYGWIAKMLDFKANVGNPRELRGLVSGTMGKLADAWFADMRADAPLTQDLEERVKAQLPENFTTEAMEPQEFIDRLAKLAGTYYRGDNKNPYKKIAEEAKQIHRKLKGYGGDWDAIEKDQNAHIGLILQDYFGDLGIARTDAVKLFRMLLAEGKDPRVTGKKERTPISVPLPTAGNAGIADPVKWSGKGKTISPGDLVSVEKIKKSANEIVDKWYQGGTVPTDILGHLIYLAPNPTNPNFADLTVRKKNASGPAYGPPEIIKTILLTGSKSTINPVADAIQEFQNGLTTFTPTDAPAGQYFIGGKTFVPNQKQSAPTNLNKFVEALLTSGFNGLKLGNVTVLNAGGSGNAVKLNVFAGDSTSPADQLTTVTIPGGKKRDIVDWLSDYGMMQAKQSGYTSLMGWMAQDLSKSMKPEMPAKSKKIQNIIDGLPSAARNRVNQLLENLQDQEWVDTFLADLPPSDIAASEKYVTDLVYGSAEGIEKAKIADAMSANDVIALGKYLYDVAKWASDKLEARKEAQMKEDDAAEMVGEEGLTLDSPAVGYAKSDDTLMTIAEAAAMVGPFEPGEIGGTNHVYFTDNSGTAITNPYEDSTGDPLVTEWAPGNKEAIMKYWADNGVLPSVSETALAIFDAANPGHPYLEAAAEYLKKPSQAAKNEAAAKGQAMEFLDNMLLDDPVKIGDNVWELESIEDDNGESVAAVVKLNGVAVSNQIPLTENMSIDAPPKAVYDAYFALDWMKDWKAPKPFKKFADPNAKPAEPGSLLTPSQDQMMQAATELITELSNEYVLESKVTIGNKNFSAKINESGNMIVFAQDKNGYWTGAYPIQGVKTMDPVDLEAAVYEAIDTLNANAAPQPMTPTAKMPTETELNEAADELLNAGDGDSVTVGGYEFQHVLGGQGGAAVNIVPEGTRDIIDAFYYDASDFDNPSDVLDVIHTNLKNFFDSLSKGTSGPGAPTPKATKITPQMINEAADALMNDETASLGKYTFEPIASGLGGTLVNIYIKPGMDDPVSYFRLDPGRYREPSDMLDAFYDKISEFLDNNPEFDDGTGGAGPGAQMMPGDAITPKTLYNFYHLATLESQGRIKSEYGQGLMKEYLDVYRQRYLDTIGPLVADQIRKYIGRGRVDEPVTEEALEAAANDPEKLDELMRQTYRSDMKRRNDVWNNITEHLKGLEAARSARDIIFRIDRLNNAIHNTNELLFSKFSNAADLMDAFEAINDARDERAYARNVDRDLRQIEEFEGGPGPARFMPADTSRLIDIEDVRPFKVPKPVRISKNRWRVGDVVTSKEPDADAAAMIAGLQRLAMHSKGVDSRKALSSVFVTLRDNPYFKRLLAMSQENLKERGMDELYRGVGVDENRSQLTRQAKSFTQFYDMADTVAYAAAESDDRRRLEPEVLRISPVGKFPVIEDGAMNDIAEELGVDRSRQPHMPGRHMEGAFGEGEVFVAPSSARPNVRFMPGALEVPTQKVLDRLKKRLPKYEVEIAEDKMYEDGTSMEVEIKILAPEDAEIPEPDSRMVRRYGHTRGRGGYVNFKKNPRLVGIAVLRPNAAEYAREGGDLLYVDSTSVREDLIGKGYGEALYREIAKYAQSNGFKYLYSSNVSANAAKVRKKLFEENKSSRNKDAFAIDRKITRRGKFWEEEPDPMLSRVGPGIQYMPGNAPGSSQVDPGLAGVAAPDTDQGPLLGARFMPDVANVEDLTSAVASILSARNVRDDRAKKWLREAYRKNFVQLGLPEGLERASLSDYRAKKGDPDWMRKPGLQRFKSLKAAEKDRIGHIADYLNTLDERELSKLPKQTLADVEKKVAEWDRMLQKKMGERAKFVNEGKDIETLETFEDGFRVVRLLSKGAYNDEGKCMGHCVGSYDPTEKNKTILSLRGPDGESHVTLELVKDFQEYADELIEDIQREGIDWDEMEGDFDEDTDYEQIATETFLEDHGISSIEDVVDMSKAVKKAKGGFIVQIKGKANNAPKKVYADKILRFIQNNSDRYVITGEGENLGLVKRGDRNQAPSGRGVDGRGNRFLEPPENVAWDPEGADPENFIDDLGITHMSRFLGEDAFSSYQDQVETDALLANGDYLYDLEEFTEKKIANPNFFKAGRSPYPKSWDKEDRSNFAEIENLDLESPKNWPKIANFLKKQFRMTGNKNRREKIDLVRYMVALVKLPAGEYKRRKPIMDQQRAAAEKIKKAEKTKIAAGPIAFRFYEEPATDLGAQMMPGSFQDGPSLAGVAAPDVDRGPLSGARFMPGYNPRYTDDDGNFDREAWLRDIQKGEEYLRRRGITRANTEKNLYEQMLREALRGPRR